MYPRSILASSLARQQNKGLTYRNPITKAVSSTDVCMYVLGSIGGEAA